MSTILDELISRATAGTTPRTRQRMQALARVRWVLATGDGRFVAVDERAQAVLTRDAALATIYDGRDNEALKADFFEALLKEPLTVVLLDE
ncbi:MAG: hypothetical protein WC718_16125 [Phycisphaerales bacterium]|jgi:hypothetical protein